MKKNVIYSLLAMSALFFDLLTKFVVSNQMIENESIPILGDYLKFTLVYNYGTTFGLFKNFAPYIFIATAKFILSVALLLFFWKIAGIIKSAKYQAISRICILVIIGGSLGNIIDRLSDKRVTDFIDIGINGLRWPIFNLADAFQVICGLIVLYMLAWGNSRERSTASK